MTTAIVVFQRLNAATTVFLSLSGPLARRADISSHARGTARMEVGLRRDSFLGSCHQTFTAVTHFQSILEGRQFTLFMNHRPLTFVDEQSPKKTTSQSIQLDYILQFSAKFGNIVDMPTLLCTKCINKVLFSDEQLPHLLENPCVELQQLTLKKHPIYYAIVGLLKPHQSVCLDRQAFQIAYRLSLLAAEIRSSVLRYVSSGLGPVLRRA